MKTNHTTKVVYNDEFCPFVLSREAIEWIRAKGYKGKFNDKDGVCVIPRHHPLLVECVETLGEKAGGCYVNKYYPAMDTPADLMVAEVPGDRYYVIDYDGKETVIGLEDMVDTSEKGKLFVDSFPAGKVYFTADTHFHNRSIIHYSGRPFKDAAEMDEELVRRWNETVPEDGIVFHLGDFAHGSAEDWLSVLQRLNGEVHLIAGNHDTATARAKALAGFASIRQQRIIDIEGQKVYLNHYPYLCYGGAYDGVWQLFGHVHSGPKAASGLDHPRLRMLYPTQYDVGVDNNDFKPVSFREVKGKIEEQVRMASGVPAGAMDVPADSRPVVFLDMDGVLVQKPLSRNISFEPSLHLEWLLRETGAGLVVTGGWAAYRTEDLKAGPLRGFAASLLGVTPQAPSSMESIAAWHAANGGKHRYVLLSTSPSTDTRSVRVNPSVGLTLENAEDALRILE